MAAPTIPYVIPGTVDHVADKPEIVCRVAFDSASTSDPLTWVDVSDRLRSFQIDRGGENELELVDTGTATVVLDNTDRALDPFNTSSPYSPNVKPRRRLWLQGQFGGETHDLFYGWTGAFKPEWDSFGDAVVNLSAQDGFAIAAGDALPTTSPPRDSYADVVLADEPTGYWKLDEPAVSEGNEFADSSPNGFTAFWTQLRPTPGQTGLVEGERFTSTRFVLSGVPRTYLSLPKGDTAADVCGNFEGKQRMSVEAWVRFTSVPVAAQGIFGGPLANNGTTTTGMWSIHANASGQLAASCLPDTGSALVATNPAAVAAGQVYHMVMTWLGGPAGGGTSTISLYVDNMLVDDTVGPGGIQGLGAYDTGSAGRATIGWNGSGPCNADLQHVALYPHNLSASRITAHYEAGALMGHGQDTTDEHVRMALEESGMEWVPRRLRTGQREILPVYFVGQPPKEWFEDAVRTEGTPAMFFFAKDGAAVFLDNAHRSVSPWNTVQATFDDDGTDLPYADLETDDGEAFIYNDVRVTADGGELQRTFDTASISEYQKRVLDRGETLNTTDTAAEDEAATLLALYKDPLPRITQLTLKGEDPAVLSHMIGRELGDKVRVLRRPTGGGSAIDQSCWIRKISLSGSDDDPYLTATWSLAQR